MNNNYIKQRNEFANMIFSILKSENYNNEYGLKIKNELLKELIHQWIKTSNKYKVQKTNTLKQLQIKVILEKLLKDESLEQVNQTLDNIFNLLFTK